METVKAIVKRYFLSFSSLNNLMSKDTFKQKLAEDCKSGKYSDKDLRHFHLVFDLIKDIKQAEQKGDEKI